MNNVVPYSLWGGSGFSLTSNRLQIIGLFFNILIIWEKKCANKLLFSLNGKV